jgi:hypothetical protein
MELHRVRPTSLSPAGRRYRGRCAACGELIAGREELVHLYGEPFHYSCAFYRPHRDGRTPDGRAGHT